MQDWDFSQTITEKNIKLYGEYLNDLVGLYKDKNALLDTQTLHKQRLTEIKQDKAKKIKQTKEEAEQKKKHVNSVKGSRIVDFIKTKRINARSIKKIMTNDEDLRLAIKWIVYAEA